MIIERGFRTSLNAKFQLNKPLSVKLNFQGSATYDICCFGVDQHNKLADDRYMIFYNQLTSPEQAITLQKQQSTTVFSVQLNKLPDSICKLVFTVNIDGSGTMQSLQRGTVEIDQPSQESLELILDGSHFNQEKAIIAIEIYRKDDWRINAVARGFNGGLSDLLQFFGGQETTSAPPPPKTISPAAPTVAPSPPPSKVELRKGQKVNLQKKEGSTFDEITINLNWNTSIKADKGLFASIFNTKPSGIDLDLACLYECKNGDKGCIQALGNSFGSLNAPPYIMLDHDDRTGSSVGGETMRINGKHLDYFKRILIFTFIYKGIVNWSQADGIVTLKCPGNPDLIVKMDEHNTNNNLCAIAMLENVDNKKISVEKLISFYPGHSKLDKAFGWGMSWVAGRK